MDILTKGLAAYGGAFVAFLILDGIWLGVVARSFYAEQLGSLMRASPNWTVAAMFYLAYVVGVVVFAILPALGQQSWVMALGLGALLGFIAYGTYDLTNLATLRDWPPLVSVVDMAWGTFLTGAISVAGYFTARAFAG